MVPGNELKRSLKSDAGFARAAASFGCELELELYEAYEGVWLTLGRETGWARRGAKLERPWDWGWEYEGVEAKEGAGAGVALRSSKTFWCPAVVARGGEGAADWKSSNSSVGWGEEVSWDGGERGGGGGGKERYLRGSRRVRQRRTSWRARAAARRRQSQRGSPRAWAAPEAQAWALPPR